MEHAIKQSALRPKRQAFYKKPGIVILTAIVILLGAILAGVFILPKGERINSSGYQVIYTATGQAYFGKLQNTDGSYLTLKEPYTAQDVKSDGGQSAQEQTTLLKVTQQTYGPEDVMSIKSDQVLFWQNLRSDSKVAQAIKSKQ